MLVQLWFNVGEGNQRLRETGLLEWICHLRAIHSPWKCSEDTLFNTTTRNKSVRWTQQPWRALLFAHLSKPDLTLGSAVILKPKHNRVTECQFSSAQSLGSATPWTAAGARLPCPSPTPGAWGQTEWIPVAGAKGHHSAAKESDCGYCSEQQGQSSN